MLRKPSVRTCAPGSRGRSIQRFVKLSENESRGDNRMTVVMWGLRMWNVAATRDGTPPKALGLDTIAPLDKSVIAESKPAAIGVDKG
jgi:hypothetical protein